MIVYRLLVLLLSSYFLLACSPPTQAPVLERSNITRVPDYHQIQAGETLYSISWMYGLDYKALIKWNSVPRPYSIYPGQRLVLKAWLAKKKKRVKKPTQKRRIKQKKKYIRLKNKNTKKHIDKKRIKSKFLPVRYWVRPTRGRVIKRFSARDSGKKGISITGKQGQAIIAAAAGKVVYSGQGLIRYGNLIIIKHNATYLSAYAHNRRLLVRQGQFVKQGQRIAEMGNTGTRKTILHFEIRKNGKSVNPLAYIGRH